MKILIAVDGSSASLDAVRHALRLAHEGLRATFVLANVQEPVTPYELVSAPDAPSLERTSRDAGRHALAEAEALVRARGERYEAEAMVGDPAHTLVDIAERYGCELIVIGSRGMGPLRRAMLGSVSQAVLNAAKVPVVVVKALADEG
jgi:nucleotide-binding universal stress UspA family protein